MSQPASTDQQSFRKLLSRNIGLPLGVGLISAVVFVAVIAYLLSVIQWVAHTDRVINNANEAVKLSIDMETGMRGFLLTGDEQFLDPYEVAKPRIQAELETLKQLVADNPQQVDRLSRLQALQAAWNNFGKDMIALRRANDDYRTPIKLGQGKRLTDEIRKEFDDFVAMEQQLRLARNDQVGNTTKWSISLYLAFVVLLSALLAYIGRRDLLNLSSNYAANLEAQQRAAERLEQQAWQRAGQSRLAEQVLGQLTLPMLGNNILQFFAHYLGSVVAAVYVRDEHGSLRRVASYGFSREQQGQEQVVGAQEGILAQAVAQRRLMRLDEVPQDYFKVSSGLGEGCPRNVLVIPAINDGQVNGVVELGFLRAVEDRDIEFSSGWPTTWAPPSRVRAIASACRKCWPKPSSSTKSCRCSRKSSRPPTKSSRNSPGCSRSPRPIWRRSRPSWSRPTSNWPSVPTRWPSSAMRWTARTAS